MWRIRAVIAIVFSTDIERARLEWGKGVARYFSNLYNIAWVEICVKCFELYVSSNYWNIVRFPVRKEL